MLVLSRSVGEGLRIGPDIRVVVIRIGNSVRLGIEAPHDVSIVREKLFEVDVLQPRETETDRNLTCPT